MIDGDLPARKPGSGPPGLDLGTDRAQILNESDKLPETRRPACLNHVPAVTAITVTRPAAPSRCAPAMPRPAVWRSSLLAVFHAWLLWTHATIGQAARTGRGGALGRWPCCVAAGFWWLSRLGLPLFRGRRAAGAVDARHPDPLPRGLDRRRVAGPAGRPAGHRRAGPGGRAGGDGADVRCCSWRGWRCGATRSRLRAAPHRPSRAPRRRAGARLRTSLRSASASRLLTRSRRLVSRRWARPSAQHMYVRRGRACPDVRVEAESGALRCPLFEKVSRYACRVPCRRRVCCSSSFLVVPAWAGDITGTAADITGAVLLSARITLRNLASGAEMSVRSGADGRFAFPRRGRRPVPGADRSRRVSPSTPGR